MKSAAVLACALGLCAAGCAGPRRSSSDSGVPYAEIYQRATNEFALAALFKPAESATNAAGFPLAPLILQQVNQTGQVPLLPDRFGTLRFSNGAPVLDLSQPTIYWDADTVQIDGKAHARFSYLWCYFPGLGEPGNGHDANAIAAGQAKPGLALQGVRITLNSAGQPAIYEVLADKSGFRVLFVAQHLEIAASIEFGPPLPGRHYSIERRVQAAPRVIVARVIDDSPMVMGPILYLSTDTQAISTLICRCMPAQAKRLVSTTTYDLQPFLSVAANPLLTQAKAALRTPVAFWPGEGQPNGRMGRYLRLPRTF